MGLAICTWSVSMHGRHTLSVLQHPSNSIYTYWICDKLKDRHKYSWSKVELLFHGLCRGIPCCIPLRWHVGESAPFSEWFMNGYGPRCGSVDAGSLKGGRHVYIKGRSWNVKLQGKLTISTSMARCGRLSKNTSSLETWTLTFKCCRIDLCPLLTVRMSFG